MISKASMHDCHDLEMLVNSAYRGESSKKGWTTEADLLGGVRTTAASLQKLLEDPSAVIMKYTDDNLQIQGCIYLQIKKDKLYLGMLTVSPTLQDKGIGKQLLYFAETYAQENKCIAIMMTVIYSRTELIAWYSRHGYQPTGETEPFPTDPAFGLPKQPLYFIVMEKPIITN